MERTQLIQLLHEYFPTAPEEMKFKEDMLNFIKHNKDCFERSNQEGHITGSAWLLNKDMNKALLMHHTKLDKWFQLGGHCDGESDVLAVAIKEAQEESGIDDIVPVSSKIFDIDIHPIPENKKEKAHYHYDVRFLLHVASDEDIIQNHESRELRWIGKDKSELPTDSLSVIRMFNKWQVLS
jgi:8-oxo-dGTP pyrophosphatase MutT (NUDIX family)